MAASLKQLVAHRAASGASLRPRHLSPASRAMDRSAGGRVTARLTRLRLSLNWDGPKSVAVCKQPPRAILQHQ